MSATLNKFYFSELLQIYPRPHKNLKNALVQKKKKKRITRLKTGYKLQQKTRYFGMRACISTASGAAFGQPVSQRLSLRAYSHTGNRWVVSRLKTSASTEPSLESAVAAATRGLNAITTPACIPNPVDLNSFTYVHYKHKGTFLSSCS